MKPEPDERRLHLGRRPEGAGRQREEPFDVRRQLDEDAEHAVLLGARPCDEAIRDLPLEHDRRVHERNAGTVEVDQREQDGGGDVVREIARHADRAGGTVLEDPLGPQEVPGNDREVRGGAFAKRLRQVAVDLERGDAPGPGRQLARQGPPAGPDLEEDIVRRRRDRPDDLDDPGRLEEMLPEPLACDSRVC